MNPIIRTTVVWTLNFGVLICNAAGQTTIDVTTDPTATIDANQTSGSPVTVNLSVATTSPSDDGLTKTDGGDLTVNFIGTGAIDAADIGINLSSGIGNLTITSTFSADPVITSGKDGLVIAGLSGDFSNAASIASSNDDAIRFSSSVGGSFTNTGDLTTGTGFGDDGISILGSVGNGFTNSGQIGSSDQRSGGSGIYMTGGTISGDFLNDTGGDIFSSFHGIALLSARVNGNFTNHASIDALSLDAIVLNNTNVNGSFTNTGDLMASLDGITISGTVGALFTDTFTNSGQIGTASQRVGQTGISITGKVTGDFLNDTGGAIFSSDQGIVLFSNLFGDFTNRAFIDSRDDIAIEIDDSVWGSFTNTGTVQGDTLGVKLGGLSDSFTNSGSITGTNDDGVEITVNSIRTFENQADGIITGSGRSVEIIGNGMNFTNAGTLNGNVVLGAATSGGAAGDFQNTVTLDSTGIVNGTLDVGTHNTTRVTLKGIGARTLATAVTGGIHSGASTNQIDGALIKNGEGQWTIDQNLSIEQGTTIEAGTLQIAGGSTLTSDIQVDGGTLAGIGSISGAVNVNGGGTLAPGNSAGTLNISGDYTQEMEGTLIIEIGGPLAGTEYDVLNLGGNALIAGNIEIRFINDYAPAGGESFTILSSGGTITDAGISYTLPALSDGLEWSVDLSATNLVLEVGYTNDLDGFRAQYELAEDGSDDALDWSGNGIANILYLSFGLGDPNAVNIDRTRLPSLENDSSFGDYALISVQPKADIGVTIDLYSTDDLTNPFVDLPTLDPAYQPVETETESLDENYERVTEHFDFVNGEVTRFYRFEITESVPFTD